MVYRPDINGQLCFVLMPFGDPFDGYYKHIITPAVEKAGLAALRADEIYGARRVMRDVWDHIWRAKLVIADVTGANPNVNYELGLCHALGVPTILITKRMEDVPFDYRDRRCIVYDTDHAIWKDELIDKLEKSIKALLSADTSEGDLPWPYDTTLLAATSNATATVVIENPRDIMLQGISALQKVIVKAYGPSGVNVSVRLEGHDSVALKKGLKIALGFRSANVLEEEGIEQMRLAARDVENRVGDGTKDAILLAHAMVKGGHLAITRGHQPFEVIQGMEVAVKTAISSLREQAVPASAKHLYRIAFTAAGDDQLASVVVDAMKRAGKDGVITVESSDNPEPLLTVLEGFRFDRGYLSEAFITDVDTKECVLDECRLLICDRRITSLHQILPALEQVARSKESLIVIADDVEGEALATLVVNRLRGTLAVVAVKAPGTGDRQRHLLHDMAILSGAKAVTSESGIDISAIGLADLGKAQKVVVTKDTTTITGGRGHLLAIESHIRSLRGEIDRTTDGFEREKLQERLTNLAGGVAIIRVGGKAHAEAEDQLYRAVSALHSTRAAAEEGCVYGGGAGLSNAALRTARLTFASEAQKAGAHVISESLEAPLRALAENSGMNPSQVVSDRPTLSSQSVGFDPRTGRLEELGENGALDPVKVLRIGIEVAFSFARGILKTGAWSQGQKKE